METKHPSGRKLLSLLLALIMLLSMLPVSAFAADSDHFALFATDTNGVLIEPCYVNYTAGQTVADALKGSGHTFTGIDDGFITAIDGKQGSYMLHFDGDNWDLSKPASEVTALWFTTNTTQMYGDQLLETVKAMAAFNTATNGVKDYASAREAYQAALDGFYAADNTAAQKLAADLNGAMQRYEDFLVGKPVTVTLNVTLDGAAVTPEHVKLTGEYGNVVEARNAATIDAVPGTYTYEITYDSFRHARGTVEVTGPDAVLTAQLPTGQWIKDVQIGIDSGWTQEGQMVRSDASASGATFQIPDYAGGDLFAYVEPGDGVDTSDMQVFAPAPDVARPWKSKASVTTGTYSANSLEGAQFQYEVRSKSNPGMYQTYTVKLVRTPSLTDLQVVGGGMPLPVAFQPNQFTYRLSTIGDTVEITPTSLSSETKITVKKSEQDSGKALKSGETLSVNLSDCQQQDGARLIFVYLETPEHQHSEYKLILEQTPSVDVTINHKDALQVFTADGAPVAPKSTPSTSQSVYALLPGTSYQCITTADQHYHASVTFEAKEGLTFDAPEAVRADWLTGLLVKPSLSDSAPDFPMEPAFSAKTHAYTVTAESNTTAFAIQANAASSDISISVDYRNHPDTSSPDAPSHADLTSGKIRNLPKVLAVGGIGNDVKLTLSKSMDSAGKPYTDFILYQDYNIHTNRQITLNGMTVADDNGNKLKLIQKDDPSKAFFNKTVLDYTVELGQNVPELQVDLRPLSSYKTDHAFTVKAVCGDWSQDLMFSADVAPNAYQTIHIPLDSAKLTETIHLTVSHAEADSIPTTYTIELAKLPSVTTTITVDPADAVVLLMDDSLNTRVMSEEDGSFLLNTGISYTYYVTKNGYIGQSSTFIAGEDTAKQEVKLEKAPDSSLTDISQPGDWHQFRADDNNNGVVNVKTPIKAEDTVLVWSNKIGDGYGSGAVGCPIIAGGYLYTYAGTSIVKVDKATGEVIASGQMAASSSFAINSPTYANGMIFVGLSNGRIQAFNAETLEPLWLYSDSRKGQPNCPITYSDGYIYTGFWNSEVKEANFVCLSVTDEDPTRTDEEKLPSWIHTDKGFYWAGAYVSENFLLVPTDDGERSYNKGHGDLLSLDPTDGHVIDMLTMPGLGDLRCSICYDETTNAYYFTSKGGDFYQVKVNPDGTFVEGSLRSLHLDKDATDPSVPPMSTSTPVIYKGRAYVGVCGTAQFGEMSGHNITVIDLNSFSIAYKVPTQGYPQVSGLLTTAYEDTGYIYVYFIDNYTPGKIRVVRDQPGRTSLDPEYTTKETYTVGGQQVTMDTGYVLFTPSGNQAQYAICSPIVDTEGNIYFKNDSAEMMCLSSVITELEVTQQPQKTTYEVGQAFDGTGLTVIAHYANDTTRDISKYLSYSSDPLTADDTEITISYDPDKLLNGETGHWQMYQDKDGAAGTPFDLPTTSVNIQVTTEHSWDDGVIQSQSTCTEHGKILYTCSVCGQTKTEDLPLADHTLTHVEGKAATCTEDGILEHYHCSVCQKDFADSEGTQELDNIQISAKGHTLVHVDAQAPTCTAEGTAEHYHCSVCQKNFADDQATTELDTVTVPAQGHGETEIRNAKEATCTEDGYTGDTYCTVCGEKVAEGQVISALGHEKTEIRNAKDATCTEDGYTGDTYCTVCGEKVAEGEVISALGHEKTEIRNKKDATCTEDGYTGDTYCSVCGEKIAEGEVIAALGHGETEIRDAKDATSTQEGYTGDTYCKKCGEKIAEGKIIPVLDTPKPVTPTTGDTTPVALIVASTLCSALAVAMLLLTRKKKHNV